jgi:hypothetical protein
MVGTFMDDQMQLLADSQVTQPASPMALARAGARMGHHVGQVFDRPQAAHCQLVASTPLNGFHTGFHDVRRAGSWRAYVARR